MDSPAVRDDKSFGKYDLQEQFTLTEYFKRFQNGIGQIPGPRFSNGAFVWPFEITR